MDISLFFAQLLGGLYLIFGLIFMLPGQYDKIINLTQNKAFMVNLGIFTLFLGLTMVILHNIWVADWRVVITIIGWIAIAKGATEIAAPRFIQDITNALSGRRTLHLIAALIFGTWLLMHGLQVI